MCSVWFYSSELHDNIGKQLCEGVSHVFGVVLLRFELHDNISKRLCERVSHVFGVVRLIRTTWNYTTT